MTDGPRDRLKAYILLVYGWLKDELAAARDEIAPQLRGVSLPSIPDGAVKPLALAGILIIGALVMPAAPFSGGEQLEDPVEGETFESVDQPTLAGATLNQLPSSYLGTSDEAPDPPKQVRASAGSQTMQVETAMKDGEPAIVLEDDRTHDGRWVALETSWFEEHVGEIPSAAYVEHESGETYAAPLQVRGESAAFYVRGFSTNTVTFSGEVRLSGSQAADGTQYQYELNDTSGVDDPSINLTGEENTRWNNISAVATNGETISADIGGNLEPAGPSSNSEPTITLEGLSGDVDIAFRADNNVIKLIDEGGNTITTGQETYDIGGIGDINGDGEPEVVYRSANGNDLKWVNADGNTGEIGKQTYGVGGVGDLDGDGEPEIAYTDTSDNLKYVDNNGNAVDMGENVRAIGGLGNIDGDGDVDIVFQPISSYNIKYIDGDGNVVDTNADGSPGGAGDLDGDGEPEIAYTDTSDNLKYINTDLSTTDIGVQAVRVGGVGDVDGDGDPEIAYQDSSDNLKYVSTDGSAVDTNVNGMPGGVADIDGDAGSPAIDVDGDGTDEVSYNGGLSGSKTYEVPSLDASDDNWTVTMSAGEVRVTGDIKERTLTSDPVVELNGETVGVGGTLSDGETVTLSQNASALQEGTNRVNISTNSPTSGPASLVGFEYSHSAETTTSATVDATTWSQSTNVSKTWAGDRANATATIPMNDRVVDIKQVEVRYNETTWEPVADSDYALDGTDLTVQLGDVAAGSTTEVRATGSKVRVQDGSISVLNATTTDGPLNTTIAVDSAGPNFAIETGGTRLGQRVHYAENASWGETNDTTTITSSGEQTMTLPGATAGGETTVKTWPIAVSPATDSVTITDTVGERTTEPGVVVDGDGNAGVSYTYLEAQDATPYVLYSTTNGIVRDEGLASSPITLTDDNSAETLVFRVDDGTASGSSSSSGTVAGAVAPMVTNDGGFNLSADLTTPLTILVSLVGIVGALFVSRRLELIDTTDRGDTVVGTARSTAQTLLNNEIIVGGAVLAGGVYVATSASLPEQTKLILALASVPVAMFLALRQFGQFDIRIWGGSTALVAVFGLQQLAPELFQTIADEAGIIIVVGGILLGWRALSAWRADANTPDQVTTLEIQAQEDDDQ